MPFFRATIWILGHATSAAQGNAAISRRIVEVTAANEGEFKERILVNYPDCHIDFGPITQKSA